MFQGHFISLSSPFHEQIFVFRNKKQFSESQCVEKNRAVETLPKVTEAEQPSSCKL